MPVFTIPIHEFNTCHAPAGSPEGGQFCSGASGVGSPAFKAWFGNSKVVDEDGKPLRVYHGTTQDFDAFDPDRGSVEADWGAGIYFTDSPDDVAANYAGIGPDLENKIEQAVDRSDAESSEDRAAVRREVLASMVPHGGLTIPVYLRMENPAIVGGDDETILTSEVEYDEDGEYVDEKGTLVDFVLALRDIASRYDDGKVEDLIVASLLDHEEGGLSLSDLRELVAKDESFGYYTDENGNLVSHEILRQALEAVGFDGIIDRTVYTKFGGGKKIGKPMAGVTPDTAHYIVFDPDQIKSALSNKGTYRRGAKRFTEQT